MLDEIGFGAGIPDTAHDLAGGHVEAGNERLGPMADVLELAALNLPRRHRPIGLGGFERLNARFFVDAYRVNPASPVRQGLPVELVDRDDSSIELLGGQVALMAQPVANAMGLKLGLLLKNARRCGRRCAGRALAEPTPAPSRSPSNG